MPTVVTKGPKMPKERPKPNAQRVQKVQNMKVKELKPNEDGLERPDRDEAPKDNLRTTESGNIIKKVPYVIPKHQR